jgi:hypothetical protein
MSLAGELSRDLSHLCPAPGLSQELPGLRLPLEPGPEIDALVDTAAEDEVLARDELAQARRHDQTTLLVDRATELPGK